jgi:hypothetical protein
MHDAYQASYQDMASAISQVCSNQLGFSRRFLKAKIRHCRRTEPQLPAYLFHKKIWPNVIFNLSILRPVRCNLAE